MKNIIIVYASKYGQTEKIARHIQATLQAEGHRVQAVNVKKDHTSPLGTFDTVIIGGSVYGQRFNRKLVRWVQEHLNELNSKTTGFFSVSLNAADKREQSRPADDMLLKKFITLTGLHTGFVASFAGALNYREYNWFIRKIMKRIAAGASGDTDTSRDYEYTDWKSVDAFTESVVTNDGGSPFLAARHDVMEPVSPNSLVARQRFASQNPS